MSEGELVQKSNWDNNDAETTKKLEKLFFECNTLLGGTSIEVQLNDDDYKTAFSLASDSYFAHSSRSYYRTYYFLTLQPGQTVYTVDEKIDTVIKIRRSRGLFGGIGQQFEPFSASLIYSFLNGGQGGTGSVAPGGIASYDFALQYIETLDRLFAREIHFWFRNDSHTLEITQTPRVEEFIMADVTVTKSIKELLNDRFSYQWLRNMTLAYSKIILGEKLSLFSSYPGPQGQATLKGATIVQKGQEEVLKYEEELLNYADSGEVPQPIRG